MKQVEVKEYELYGNPETGEVRALINDDYLVIVKDKDAQDFADSAIIEAGAVIMPAQHMVPQRFISDALENDDDVTLWNLNYYIEDDDLTKFYDGEIETVEFILPNHEDAVEFLKDLTEQ
ncbi:MAG: hypothetical protein H9W81_13545 [Enterococcus sp.]|nr:hypothetical protein [Enterococcus sp.]